jgi:hypothetical protein
MAQEIRSRPLTAETRVRAWAFRVGFVVDEVALGMVFSPSFYIFPCQYHSTVALRAHVSSGGLTIGPSVAAVHTPTT